MAAAASASAAAAAAALPRVGWVGVGVMGRSMCGHLLRQGYPAAVFNRTPEKCAPLVEQGARLMRSPREVAQASDIVFTMVGLPSDVESVILGEEGVLRGLARGGVLVDMTTSSPELARRIAREAAARGVQALDAPVSGGDVGAREARLSIMVGGERAALERVEPLLRCMGKNITHLGGAGQGQQAKMVNQILIATNMIGVVEGLLYARKAGLDLEQTIAAVGSGAAGSWSINNLGPRIAARNFEPGFFVEHFLKDLGIALEEARRMGLALPGLALAQQLYLSVQALGLGRKGTQALALALERMNGLDAQPPAP